MLNNDQIKLVQTAVRAAGLRGKDIPDARYRMLLGQYKLFRDRKVTSSKQLNNWQLEDLLAICESLGWRIPGKPETYFRDKVRESECGLASRAQQEAIKKLADDLTWSVYQLEGFIEKFSLKRVKHLDELSVNQAHGTIEALKAMGTFRV